MDVCRTQPFNCCCSSISWLFKIYWGGVSEELGGLAAQATETNSDSPIQSHYSCMEWDCTNLLP